MALLNCPTQVYSQLPKFLQTLQEGTAPSVLNRQFLKDIGFKSSNHHAFIPLLKGLGFLTADGSPTERYRNFLDQSRAQRILAEAVLEAYGDIFVIKNKPTSSDLASIKGKFKSTFNQSDLQAERNARTFLALWESSDQNTPSTTEPQTSSKAAQEAEKLPIAKAAKPEHEPTTPKIHSTDPTFHYNIQIHLPATKDVEVYNAIFKSLRSHLID